MIVAKTVLVTGAKGFIGKNLVVRLKELNRYNVTEFSRQDDLSLLPDIVSRSDFVIHLAGENRPKSENDFDTGNVKLTEIVCDSIRSEGREIPLLLASSAQAKLGNAYGKSKLNAEKIVTTLTNETGNPTAIYRLPGVFGKWCRPNYNSVVATFCNNITNDLPIEVNDPGKVISLVYIDDLIDEILSRIDNFVQDPGFSEVAPEHQITLGELAAQISAFQDSRSSLVVERVGSGLTRALYATYLSYSPASRFVYDLPSYADNRGTFVEMLKTYDSGQFSYFTSAPGITRGNHYHHTKNEKFLVMSGSAEFAFRNLVTDELHIVRTFAESPQVVETVPGWTHNITNIGDSELVVMLWANEIFDREYPDTVAMDV